MSIFDLKQSASELPSLNQGMAKMTYMQVPPTRDVTGNNFPNGQIHIRFEVAGTRWWCPAKSYIRMRAGFFQADGTTPVVVNDDIAPNMGIMSSILQSAEFRIADKTVSRVSDYMAQVDALEKRLTKSNSWMDSAGSDLEAWDPSQAKRLANVSSDGCMMGQEVPQAGLDRLEQGFDAATNTIQVTAVAPGQGTIVWAAAGGAAIPDVRVLYKVGDVIDYLGIKYTITGFTTALIVRVTAPIAVAAVAPAAAVDWFLSQGTSDNYCGRRNRQEYIWQPPLSVFKLPHCLPSGKYELVLNPQNSSVYQKRAIESAFGDKAQGAAGDFQFIIDDYYLYVSTVEGPAVSDLSYFMSLEETRCQQENVDNTTGLQQKNFDVSPNTYALTMAFQGQENGTRTDQSASKFKVPQIAAAPLSYPSGELALNRVYIQYNGENKPSPDGDPDYLSPRDYLKSRYAETQLYSGAYWDAGGPESYKLWLQRGFYMYFAYPKDGLSESTRVNVNFSFQTQLNNDSGRVLLFDHHRSVVLVSISNGRVIDVVTQ